MVVWGCLGVSAHSTVRLLDIGGRLREGFDEMTTPNKICRRWNLGTGSALDVVPVRVVVTVAWMAQRLTIVVYGLQYCILEWYVWLPEINRRRVPSSER